MKYESRYSTNPLDFKHYDTKRTREQYLIPQLFEVDEIMLTYTHEDRFIAGGAFPMSKALKLETIEPLKADYFLHRRELGVVNVGGKGEVSVDGVAYVLDYKEALYVGSGDKEVIFKSLDSAAPAQFYLNSTPAHQSFPNKKIGREDAIQIELGSPETANHRMLNKLIVNETVETCQLQMGMTALQNGSVWNTMPAHVHDRRMEVYFYFEVPEDQAVMHLMGEQEESRHIWMHDKQAVISPAWSMHSGAGTASYTFIWGMAGENLDYGDMDIFKITDLK
ncbi:5-dehydro-4-deoxy-D-glucuronate isomerase [Persicobacter psychrovividus]|uniref:4-deoxy-L-threo-5-hexosulose-uronate ketol-isomerase n=1 Tax=Persicobacter psychrovividus TaxID=387638 RepID=A0ABN6LG92_9BACT|nr:4-deoxy-L-threo-5-hexosulose-uronate ketol-isomerase [Persicobacter psychrovividus]